MVARCWCVESYVVDFFRFVVVGLFRLMFRGGWFATRFKWRWSLARMSMIVEELVAGNIQDGVGAAMVSITRRRLRWEQSPAVWLFRCQCGAM